MSLSSLDSDASQPRAGPALDLIALAASNQPTMSVAQASPATRIDLSRTLFSHWVPKRLAQRLQTLGRVWFDWLIPLFWLSQGAFLALPFIDDASGSLLLSMNVVLALPALVVSTGSLSRDMLRILVMENEFRVVMVLNTIQWIAVACTFQWDRRISSCLIEWWVIQLTFCMDANFRLYEIRLRNGIAAVFVTSGYLAYSVSSNLHGSFSPWMTINSQPFLINDVLLWTAPTLLVLLLRCVYHQATRRRHLHMDQQTSDSITRTPASVVVYCSIHKARLTLIKRTNFGSRRQLEVPTRPSSPMGVATVRSNTTVSFLDITHTLVKTPFPLPIAGLRGFRFVTLYAIGVLSFFATCVATMLCQFQPARPTRRPTDATSVAIAALIGTVVFCGFTTRYYHRTVLLLLCQTFDAVFSSLQFVSSAVLLCDLVQWDARCLNVATWTIWFHWVLCLDALTPPMRCFLRIQKLAATPIVLFTLYAVASPLVLLYGGLQDTRILDRDVVHGVRVSALLVARIATMLLWNTRLLYDVGLRDDNEFIFVKDWLEYAVPIHTVDDSMSFSERKSSANAVIPNDTINPLLFPAPTISNLLSGRQSRSPAPRSTESIRQDK